MSQISVSNMSFYYDGSYDDIFTDVSFQIDTDWKLGFCGRNGRGKTTFLKLLMGEFEYIGKIIASVDFEYFPFNVSDDTQNTIDILQQIAQGAELWEIETELSKLDVAEDVLNRPFSTLSNGEQTKALLCGLFLRENSFLLIDEPTNHLDMAGRETVSRYLSSKSGFILVSHDRAFLDDCVDHILSINKANIEVISGNFTSWWEQKKRRDASEIAEDVKLRKEIKRLEKTAREKAQWSDKIEASKKGRSFKKEGGFGHVADRGFIGANAARMMKKSKAIELRQHHAAEEKSKLLKNIEEADNLKIHPIEYHASTLIRAENLSISYGENTVLHDLNFSLNRGERLALLGGNGSGKSSVVKLLCGEDISHTGTFSIGSRLKISYVPQESRYLTGDLREYAFNHGIDESLFMTILRKLDFSRVQFEKDIGDYSAGQKKKVLIARSLCEQAHVYIWDEPLNYIDVLSRVQIEELITTYRPTMIFIEHDRTFCENIATKMVRL